MKKLYSAATAVLALVALTSCNGVEDFADIKINNKGVTNVTFDVERDAENGTVTFYKKDDAGNIIADTTFVVALGNVDFAISEPDTVEVITPTVAHLGFTQVSEDSKDTQDGYVTLTKTVKKYTHSLDKYSKEVEISYLDAKVNYWGKTAQLPLANGNVVASEEAAVTLTGSKDGMDIYESKTSYDVYFQNSVQAKEAGIYYLAVDAENPVVSYDKTGEGYETIDANAGTAKSWIEITYTHKNGEKTTTKFEVILNNSISAPVFEVREMADFAIVADGQTLNDAVVAGTRSEGNISVTVYNRSFLVANNRFSKTFVMKYEKPVWSDGTKTFEMPYREYENIENAGFEMNEMSAVEGFDRMMYVHTMNATFNEHFAAAQAQVEIRVKEAVDEEVDRKVTDSGLTYVDENTNNAWIKGYVEYSISGRKEWNDNVLLTNTIKAPAKIVKVVTTLGINEAGDELGAPVLVKTEQKGNFEVTTYEQKYTLKYDVYNREFVLSYQKATYKPLEYAMPFAEYQNVSGTHATEELPATEDYTCMGVNHNVSADFNGHAVSSVAEGELRKEIRTVPEWAGAPVKAIYSRTQKNTGDRFEDMVVFIYENAYILAPDGKVNMELIFPKSEAGASCNSAVWNGTNWYPALVSVSAKGSNKELWSYASMTGIVHTVYANDAIGLNIGKDVSPIPSAQSYKVNGNKITITYSKGNTATADTTISLR